MLTDCLTPETVATLYSLALESDSLAPLASLIGEIVGVNAAAIIVKEEERLVDLGVTPAIQQTHEPYVSHYGKFDVWQQAVQRYPRDRAVISSEYVPDGQLIRTEFYNDFARPHGMRRPMGAKMQIGSANTITIAVEQLATTYLFEEEDKPRLQLLLPHLKGALQLRFRQRAAQLKLQLHTASAALDALAFGAVICDAAGQVLFANPAAQECARGRAGLVLGRAGAGIGASMPAETRKMAALIHDAAQGGPGGGLRLTAPDGGSGLMVLITPLPAHLGNHRPGHALVAMRPAADDPSFSTGLLAALFGLSPAQAQIAMRLFQGRSAEEIAAERGTEISTLRTHLAQIFVRTGAENQRDLIRLLGLLPPLRRPRAE